MKEISFKEILSRIDKASLPSADLVIGVGRGGVIPASLVAERIKADLKVINVEYRDDENNPAREEPMITAVPSFSEESKEILLVDDVSVTGKTLDAVKSLLEGHNVRTLVLKGKGDIVLFPEIEECVKWPWQAE